MQEMHPQIKHLIQAGGGTNIAAGTLYAQYNVQENDTYTTKFFDRPNNWSNTSHWYYCNSNIY